MIPNIAAATLYNWRQAETIMKPLQASCLDTIFRVLDQHFISATPTLLTQTQQLSALAQLLNHEVATLSFSDLDLLVSDFNSRANAQKELQIGREKNCELQIALSQIEKSHDESSQELRKLKIEHNNPALHYLKFGGFEGRNPGPDFNSQDYLDAKPDVAAAGINPLYHYLRFGQAENRPLY